MCSFQASLFRILSLVMFLCGLAEASFLVVEPLMQKIHGEICWVDADILAAIRLQVQSCDLMFHLVRNIYALCISTG